MKDDFMDHLKKFVNLKVGILISKFKAALLADNQVKVKIIKHDPSSTLGKMFSSTTFILDELDITNKIERRAHITELLGKRPLWEGYLQLEDYPTKIKAGAQRSSNEVRTISTLGRVFTKLVVQLKPTIVAEFGTAFGVSGMYWLAGLEKIRSGKLLTFEVNKEWAKIAKVNLKSISDRFILTVGAFEDNIDKVLRKNQKINIAFIDAIHTDKFVSKQLKIVMKHLSKKGIVVFDDVDFSEDMKNCWKKICADKRFETCIEIQGVGIVQCIK
jgi:predicted O-methyltransferase YrrM